MKKIRIILISFLGIFLLAVIFALLFRETLLHKGMNRVIKSLEKKYDLDININKAGFKGLSAVSLEGITVVPLNRDTLIAIQNFDISVDVFPILFGHIKIASLKSNGGKILLSNKDGIRNFDFLFKKETKDTVVKSKGNIDLASVADNLINELLYKVPDEMLIEDYQLHIRDEEHYFRINAETISINDHVLNSTFSLNDRAAIWHAEGMVDAGEKQLEIKFFGQNTKVELPYIKDKFDLKLSFDTISTRMDKIVFEDDQLKIFGNWRLKNLLVNHPKISQKDVAVDLAYIDCNMFVGENFISIDSSSVAFLGKIKAHPFVKYTISPNKIYELKLDTEEMSGQDFFNSFPAGLFSSIEGIKVKGNLAYHLDFYLDEKTPWKCKFDSELKKRNFEIIAFGEINLSKMNGSFVHTHYDYGRPVRSFIVGPANPNFTPYDQISDYIKNALLTTEDPLFFSHRGFYEEAFRQSIATNFVAKKFKRGGSTISMQLVKNVFLSRNKTVARKLEEILVVWLIENNRLTSKQRMFEVYLNIIEWAPNVYGIAEASRFYFDKSPSQLNLGESIFLASIVPKPKKFKYSFLPNGELKPYMRNYFRFIGNLMVKREKVPEADTINIFNTVELRGNARNYVVIDTVKNENESFFKSLFFWRN